VVLLLLPLSSAMEDGEFDHGGGSGGGGSPAEATVGADLVSSCVGQKVPKISLFGTNPTVL
jgi:hypothetical protein